MMYDKVKAEVQRAVGRRVLAGLDQACVAREEPQSQLARLLDVSRDHGELNHQRFPLLCHPLAPFLVPCRGPQAAAYAFIRPSSVFAPRLALH